MSKKIISKTQSLSSTLSIKPEIKFKPWEKFAPRFKLGKDSRAGVFLDKKGAPQAFVFDTWALLDILSEIDEALLDKLSDEEYSSKAANPAGWLIGEIESKLPVSKDFAQSVLAARKEAVEKGWIPAEEVFRNLKL